MPVYCDALFNDTVIPTAEVAAILGLSIWSVQRLARDRVLIGHQEYGFGLALWFDVAEVRKLRLHLANRMRPGPPLYARPALLRHRKPIWEVPDKLAAILESATRKLLAD